MRELNDKDEQIDIFTEQSFEPNYRMKYMKYPFHYTYLHLASIDRSIEGRFSLNVVYLEVEFVTIVEKNIYIDSISNSVNQLQEKTREEHLTFLQPLPEPFATQPTTELGLGDVSL